MNIWGYEESEKKPINLFHIYSTAGAVVNPDEEETIINIAKIAKNDEEKEIAHYLCLQIFHYFVDNRVEYADRFENYLFPLGIITPLGVDKTREFIRRMEDEQKNLREPRKDSVLLKYYELRDLAHYLKLFSEQEKNPEMYNTWLKTNRVFHANKIYDENIDVVIPIQKKFIPNEFKSPRL